MIVCEKVPIRCRSVFETKFYDNPLPSIDAVLVQPSSLWKELLMQYFNILPLFKPASLSEEGLYGFALFSILLFRVLKFSIIYHCKKVDFTHVHAKSSQKYSNGINKAKGHVWIQ